MDALLSQATHKLSFINSSCDYGALLQSGLLRYTGEAKQNTLSQATSMKGWFFSKILDNQYLHLNEGYIKYEIGKKHKTLIIQR